MNYWWINADPEREEKDGGPRSWTTSVAVGQVEQWNAERYDQDDEREGLRPNFDAIKKDDLILGYNINTEKKIVAKGIVTNGQHRVNGRRVIDIKKTEDAVHPVSLHDLIDIPELCKFTKSRALLGTIKALHPTQYKMLVEMMDKEE
ncbi:hypothetical protein K9O30_06715 [Clostridium bowmanii]|uniref:hypothetical protein n=1 Tax=Clostridium bowmanii TaxID=132925 RepID=UPI001C0ACF14|nr:hypothetical protein [Clostridium bowmanii]MBU3191315.1 hypothetical protein [Clostridium bowmanii]MCA1073431.1 hypothetical protein [Clostridium bowmanii]